MAKPIAILSSMDQEICMVEERLDNPVTLDLHGHRFVSGSLNGTHVVTSISGYGKVCAAATTAAAIYEFGVGAVVFGGVAGGLRPEVDIGDVVVADRLVQHDFDASPLFARYVVPSLGKALIEADSTLTEQLAAAAERYIATRAGREIVDVPNGMFRVTEMKLHRGLIASGDRFISNLAEAGSLLGQFPDVLAVEMEGAAVAQVCAERRVPFAVFRSISDRSDQDADVDFMSYVSSVAAPLTAGIVEEWTLALN
ncbi:MAG: 5'-methylthioadenosine/adenosylhomocysteine nucleosidase [Acidimicrobiia bacterium]|nr:5'-methylthioadenosine/adenosylhomocysteine nucleosidase [Acidimicrobiia bacterium]